MPAAVFVILAATLWGTTGTAQALGPDGLDPLVVGWTRLAVGGIGLVALARLLAPAGAFARVRTLPRRRLLGAVVAIGAYQLTFFGGVRLAGVALGTAVGIGSAPIWGGLLDWRLRGWRPPTQWTVAVAIAVGGAVLVAGEPGDAERPLLGLALAVGAGCSYALYASLIQDLVRDGDGVSPDALSAAVFGAAALLLAPIAIVRGGSDAIDDLTSGSGALMALHLGLVATTLSYALFTRGVRDTTVATATLLTMAEPITAVTLGVVVVGETIERPAIVGVALLIVGVGLGATARSASGDGPPAEPGRPRRRGPRPTLH